MQYISLSPIALSLADKENHALYHGSDGSEAEDEKQEQKNKQKIRLLMEKQKQHSGLDHTPSQKDRALARVVNQINWTWELERLSTLR